jgi:carbon storage regulator
VLVLTRRSRESIMIGDDVEVTVVSVSREKVRLGIRAPSGVPVHRREIYLAIHDAPSEGAAEEAPDPRSGRDARKAV